MSCRYLRNGIWWYRARIDGKDVYCSLKTQSSVVAKERQAQKDVDLRTKEQPQEDSPIRTILDRYIEEKKFRRASETNADSKRKILAFIEDQRLERLSDVTASRMEAHLNKVLASGKSEWTVSNILEYNRIFMKWCVDNNLIKYNALKSIKKYKPVSKTIRYLTSSEIRKVLLNAKNEPLFPAVATAIHTGMRKAELFSLTPDDIDLKAGIIHVRSKEGFTTKNKENRVIGINNKLKTVLKASRPHNGRMFDITNNRRILRRILRKAGFPWAGWHTFRHSFASELIKQGVDVYSVSKILGHKSVSITEKTYLHSSPEHQRKAVEKLGF